MTSCYIARKKYVKNKNYLYARITIANFGGRLKNKMVGFNRAWAVQ